MVRNISELLTSVWSVDTIDQLTSSLPSVMPGPTKLVKCVVNFGELPDEDKHSMVFSIPGSGNSAFATFVFDGAPPNEQEHIEFLDVAVNIIGLAIHRLAGDRGVSSQLAAIGHEIAAYQQQVNRLVGALNLIAGTSHDLLAEIGHDPLT